MSPQTWLTDDILFYSHRDCSIVVDSVSYIVTSEIWVKIVENPGENNHGNYLCMLWIISNNTGKRLTQSIIVPIIME